MKHAYAIGILKGHKAVLEQGLASTRDDCRRAYPGNDRLASSVAAELVDAEVPHLKEIDAAIATLEREGK